LLPALTLCTQSSNLRCLFLHPVGFFSPRHCVPVTFARSFSERCGDSCLAVRRDVERCFWSEGDFVGPRVVSSWSFVFGSLRRLRCVGASYAPLAFSALLVLRSAGRYHIALRVVRSTAFAHAASRALSGEALRVGAFPVMLVLNALRPIRLGLVLAQAMFPHNLSAFYFRLISPTLVASYIGHPRLTLTIRSLSFSPSAILFFFVPLTVRLFRA